MLVRAQVAFFSWELPSAPVSIRLHSESCNPGGPRQLFGRIHVLIKRTAAQNIIPLARVTSWCLAVTTRQATCILIFVFLSSLFRKMASNYGAGGLLVVLFVCMGSFIGICCLRWLRSCVHGCTSPHTHRESNSEAANTLEKHPQLGLV